MNPLLESNPLFRDAVHALSVTPQPDDPPGEGHALARAHNFLFDERVADERAQGYWADLGLTEAARLQTRHDNYVVSRLQKVTIPDTFRALNGRALLSGLESAGNQVLVRIENLAPVLSWLKDENVLSGESQAFDLLCQQHSLFQTERSGTPAHRNATAFLEDLLDYWNRFRDHRPSFVAFRDELWKDLSRPDWMEALRSRLGLAHYNPRSNQKIYWAVMVYTVQEVLEAGRKTRGAAASFAVPTVLDQAIWNYFFPAPVDFVNPASYGRAMALEPVSDTGRMVAELLHIKLDYLPKHFDRFGILQTSIPPHPLKVLRNAHLEALRVETVREDFGEMIP
ncbi:MAG: hypothetical protein HQM00_01930 [Magnetococcales bacterium]|nr:hypothetical protein [Magnetococcales bacterium]